MCALFGIDSPFAIGQTLFASGRLKEALNLMHHRGPDSGDLKNYPTPSEAWMQSLGHLRLAITGVQNGHQPLTNASGTLRAVVNGEFYDWQERKASYAARGYQFFTQTDSEILLAAYELDGYEGLTQLHGEFAFALYDSPNDRWIFGRDRFGIKPLSVYQDPRTHSIAFASEAKSLAKLWTLGLQKDALWFALHFQYLPQGAALFNGVEQVPPAHWLIFDMNRATGIHRRTLRSYYQLPTSSYTPADTHERVRGLLEAAVARRIPQEVPFCAHISSGLDSSSICALAKQHGLKDVFTVQFLGPALYDEWEGANLSAKHLGITVHKSALNAQGVLAHIDQAVWHSESLSINGHLSGKWALNAQIAEHGYKVALSGEGSDEIFMGYSHLKQDYLSAKGLSGFEQQYLSGLQLPQGATLNLDQLTQVWGGVPTFLAAKSSMAQKLSGLWMTDYFTGCPNPNEHLLNDVQTHIPNFLTYSPLKRSAILWQKYALSGYILKTLDDAQSMAHSIEGRLPFLDTELADFVFSLDDTSYFDGNVEKGLLRSVMQSDLAPEILCKTKQTFMSAPLSMNFDDFVVKNYVYQHLLEGALTEHSMFDKNRLESFLHACATQSATWQEPLLMTLLTLESFTRQYMTPQSSTNKLS